MVASLRGFFEPEGVAVIGASANPNKLSYGILKNLKESGYQGEIVPINPKEEEILGLQCYPDISEAPNPVDLAVIVLPSSRISEVVEKCGQKGIKTVTVISGGFREIGPQGRALENKLIEIAQQYHIRLIGPNCVGTMNLTNGLNTTFIKGTPARGGIGFISQSGAVCGGVVDHVAKRGIGFSHFLSLGNEADVDESDVMEYLAQDDDTQVIAAYIEGIQDGGKFLRIGEIASAKKPVVILKAGRSEQGAKAVSSHTGSLAGSQTAYAAAFKQIGAIEVKNTADLLNVSNALDWLPLASGKRVAIITNAGGPAALASDSLAEHGVQLATLSEQTHMSLREKLNPSAQVHNPIDMLGGADGDEYAHAMQHVLSDDNVDMVLAILVPQALVIPQKVAAAIATASNSSKKPVLACFMGLDSVQEARLLFNQWHVPMIDFPEQCGPILGALYFRYEWLHANIQQKKESHGQFNVPFVKQLIVGNRDRRFWGEHHTRPILDAYQIPLVRGDFVSDLDHLLESAHQVGYPLVLKVGSEDVLHKSEYGAICTNIPDDQELLKAVEKIQDNVLKRNPKARIEGYLVEQMAPKGQEVIVGLRRDATFGPLLMFGLGGVFVELFRDVSFRVAPINSADAHQMIAETKAFKLLNGWRGGPQYDLDGVVDVLIKLNRIAIENPEIEEIEINPLLVLPEKGGVLSLDSRMILEY